MELTIQAIASIIYGLLSLGGGIFGYQKSGSKVSLISGVVSGVILFILSAIAIQGGAWAYSIAAIVVGLLVVVFCIRYFKTKKFMPAIPMIALGVATLVVLILN